MKHSGLTYLIQVKSFSEMALRHQDLPDVSPAEQFQGLVEELNQSQDALF